MTKILIADASKPSLVMSSEVFKDKIPGSLVFVAGTGAAALALVAQEKPDICLVDFDLPDVDGATLILELRKIYSGPILMTAFPDTVVHQAVSDHLFWFNDASAWVSKPVKFDTLSEKIDAFLVDGRRLGKRFVAELEGKLIAKSAGRGKRTPKISGKITNLSLGGACLKLDGPVKIQKLQEITLSIAFPVVPKAGATPPPTTAAAKKAAATPRAGAKVAKVKTAEAKFKAVIAWVAGEREVGLHFNRLSDAQRKGLESFLRKAVPETLSSKSAAA